MTWRICLAAIITAALSLFAWNAPRAQFNGCKAGFCNLAGATASGPTYNYDGSAAYDTTSGCSTTMSTSINIGSAAANRTIVVGSPNQIQAPTGITVNGVSLSVQANDGYHQTFWSGVVAAGSGSQTVASTFATAPCFNTDEIYVWSLYGLSSSSVKQTAHSNTPLSINVTAGDFLAVTQQDNTATYLLSTQTPTGTDKISYEMAWWNIVSTNASFQVVSTRTGKSILGATFR